MADQLPFGGVKEREGEDGERCVVGGVVVCLLPHSHQRVLLSRLHVIGEGG